MRRTSRRIDAEVLSVRKGEGKESKLSYTENLLMENRNGLIVDAELFQVNGMPESGAALVYWRNFLARNR